MVWCPLLRAAQLAARGTAAPEGGQPHPPRQARGFETRRWQAGLPETAQSPGPSTLSPDFATEDKIGSCKRDGAVLLKGEISPQWIDKLRDGIDTDLATPTANFARRTEDPDVSAALEDFLDLEHDPRM
ncbi:MAG: hypothetical protein AAGA38_09770 [Pseudomonadota bacterium]